VFVTFFTIQASENAISDSIQGDVKTIRFATVQLCLTYLLMELSPSGGAANCAAAQEFPSILWNPKDHYCVHKSPPLVSIQG
jgi:hypothetical protein